MARKAHRPNALVFIVTAIVCGAIVAAAPVPAPSRATPYAIHPQAMQAHLSFLADDLLEGREAGTRGYDIAAKYVAAQFAAIGLAPGSSDGTYFQNVPLRKSSLVAQSSRLIINAPSGSKALANSDGVLIDPSMTGTDELIEAPVTFAGYGLVAPEFGIDDYAHLNVKGHIVALLTGSSPAIPEEAAAHYASNKGSIAQAHGAIGILLLYTPTMEALFAFDRLKNTFYGPQTTWIGPNGEPNDAHRSSGRLAILNEPVAKELFAGAPRSFESVVAEASSKPSSSAGFPLKVSLRIDRHSQHESTASANVVGVHASALSPALRRHEAAHRFQRAREVRGSLSSLDSTNR